MDKSEFTSQRSNLLLENFRKSIALQSKISAIKAFHEAVNAPAPRFWVGEARASRIISMMKKGEDPTGGMNPEKREMYQEIFRRFKALSALHPDWPVGDLVFTVINNPAPRSYMSWHRARHIINLARKKSKEMKNRSGIISPNNLK